MNNDNEHKVPQGTEDTTETTESTDTDALTDTVEEFEEVNEEGEIDARTTIKKLREKIKKLESEKKEYLDLSQRMRADYMNLKKEVEAERITGRKFATKKFIEELLPVLDAYDMAKGNKTSWEAVDQNWRVGIEYIFGQLQNVLEREGVSAFGKVGDVFDPNLHDSMETVPVTDPAQDDTLMKVLQSGYQMHDTILRPARVHTGHLTE